MCYCRLVGQMSAPPLASTSASPSCAPPPSAARARHLTPFLLPLKLLNKSPLLPWDEGATGPSVGLVSVVGGARYRGPSWRTPDNRPGAPKMMKAPAPPFLTLPLTSRSALA